MKRQCAPRNRELAGDPKTGGVHHAAELDRRGRGANLGYSRRDRGGSFVLTLDLIMQRLSNQFIRSFRRRLDGKTIGWRCKSTRNCIDGCTTSPEHLRCSRKPKFENFGEGRSVSRARLRRGALAALRRVG